VGELNGLVKLAKLDVTNNMDTAAQLEVKAIPAVFAYSNGKVIDSFVGGLPKHQVEKFVQKVLQQHTRANDPERASL
jgi:putative thioredoxin